MTDLTTPNTAANGGQILTDALLSKAGRALSDRHADDCDVNRKVTWELYGKDFVASAHVALSAIEADLCAAFAAGPTPVSGTTPHPEITPMFLLNSALCIEDEHGVPQHKKDDIVEKLNRIAQELQDAKRAAAPAPVSGMPEVVATKWAIYYDNLGEQTYTSRFMNEWNLYCSRAEAEAEISQWSFAKHYSARKVAISALPSPQAPAAPNPTGEAK